MVSFNVVSEIAIVPESEWRMPTLISATACVATPHTSAEAIRNLFILSSSAGRNGTLLFGGWGNGQIDRYTILKNKEIIGSNTAKKSQL